MSLASFRHFALRAHIPAHPRTFPHITPVFEPRGEDRIDRVDLFSFQRARAQRATHRGPIVRQFDASRARLHTVRSETSENASKEFWVFPDCR